jgi:hypothetical protein
LIIIINQQRIVITLKQRRDDGCREEWKAQEDVLLSFRINVPLSTEEETEEINTQVAL